MKNTKARPAFRSWRQAWSMMTLKTRGHPVYKSILTELVSAEAEGDDVCVVRFTPQRSRDMHLIVGGLPIFSAKLGRSSSRKCNWE